jgi:outer membrane protein insertion porin family
MLTPFGLLAALAIALPAAAADAEQSQTAAGNPTTVCGLPIPAPRAQPPANSGPVVYQIILCFEAQGNQTLIEQATYLYYIHLKPSRPSEDIWMPWNEEAERTAIEDSRRLWATNFLDNFSVETEDYAFSNGVVGKLVIYKMEERQRVKNVDYAGSKKVERAKIEEKLKELNSQIRLDTFIDAGLVKKVEGIVRDMMREKGFEFAAVTHEIRELPGGPKLVDLRFNLEEGPKVKIRRVEVEGNKAVSDRALLKQMKENKPVWFLSFMSGRGTYQENKFAEDAERMVDHYRDLGFINAQVGDPELKYLDGSDQATRWVELRIPVVEGSRYRVGELTFEGNTVVKTDALRPLFNLKEGDYYSQGEIRKGFQKAQEVYGAGGYMDFTGYPDNKPRDVPNPAEPQTPAALAADLGEPKGPPIVDVTLRLQEGRQFFINRITFVGNTTTRDNVIRRELRLYENGVFNTEMLKYSVRRLNQLGYFKTLEGPPKDVAFEKTPGVDGKVDVRFTLEEQNRNQLTFGAGVSQFEGFFGQLSFQTANFLGRGESLTVSLQGGSRAQNYNVAFTEPFLFDRNITGGVNLFRQEIRYVGQYSQHSTGGSLTFGFPLGTGFTRMFANYSYQRIRVTEVDNAYFEPGLLARNPWLRDSLLIGSGGVRTVSRITPSVVHNTIDQPIFPTAGRRLTASVDLAGLGGNTSFVKPTAEGVWYFRQNTRMSLGLRGQVEYVHPYAETIELPAFERLFLGGEYSVRGFDLRTIAPSDPVTGLVLGGNKSLLFNVEQNFTIAGPVRLILFYDAGQVREVGQPLSWWEDITQTIPPPIPFLFDPTATVTVLDPSLPIPTSQVLVIGRRSAFKTSTGAEIRFFMPVLNVPFRLIFAYNPQRGGVLDNQFQPQKAFQFRFAVGTTF